MIPRISPTVAAIVAAVAVSALFLASGLGYGRATRTVYLPTSRTCYPLAHWNGGNVSPDYRPCARIAQVFEDGSVRVQVSDADGTVRYSAGIGARDR
jgi:hypothetical protein